MVHRFRWDEPILSPTEVKRQHYVPRAYLRGFAGEDGNLRVVDLEAGKEFRASEANAGLEGHFYDIEIEGEALSTESWLSDLESKALPVIQRLLENPNEISRLSRGEELALARFVAAFVFRTPAFRAWAEELSTSLSIQTREMMVGMLANSYDLSPQDAEELTVQWEKESLGPEANGNEVPAATEMSTRMLGETQGFANLIMAAPWRIGCASGPLQLYTSDNPVSGYLRPVRPWWDTGAFASRDYYLALSKEILLKFERRPDHNSSDGDPRHYASRRHRDFSAWEVSIARHVISRGATRFLYGDGTVVPRQCAEQCLNQVELAIRKFHSWLN